MKLYAIAFVSTAVVFLALDFVWLGFAAKDFYRAQLGPLMLEKPLLGVAVAFYLLYTAGMVTFAVVPALTADSWLWAMTAGAFFGLVAYSTYDLTNLATLRGWSVNLALVDIAWGAILTSVASMAGFFAARNI